MDAKPLPECQSLYLFPDPTTLEEMSSTSAGDLIAELKAADAAWIVGELDVKTASGILYDAWNCQQKWWGEIDEMHQDHGTTVDGRNPAPVDR